MTAGLAVIKVIEEENLRKNAAEVGGYLRQGLEGLKEKYPVIGDVRGMGLMQGLELVKDRETKEPAPQAVARVMEETKRQKVLIGKGGLYGNVIRMAPSMLISKSELDDAMKRLDKALAET